MAATRVRAALRAAARIALTPRLSPRCVQCASASRARESFARRSSRQNKKVAAALAWMNRRRMSAIRARTIRLSWMRQRHET
eukprot:scaffold59238_cov27-Tisochrysis_lutea.AAC.10